jgi:hypothetical protein
MEHERKSQRVHNTAHCQYGLQYPSWHCREGLREILGEFPKMSWAFLVHYPQSRVFLFVKIKNWRHIRKLFKSLEVRSSTSNYFMVYQIRPFLPMKQNGATVPLKSCHSIWCSNYLRNQKINKVLERICCLTFFWGRFECVKHFARVCNTVTQ